MIYQGTCTMLISYKNSIVYFLCLQFRKHLGLFTFKQGKGSKKNKSSNSILLVKIYQIEITSVFNDLKHAF